MSHTKNRLISAAAMLIVTCAGPQTASGAEPLEVVTSFSILGDLVGEVGGEHVDVATLVGPNGDAHVYEPSPADARRAAGADLVVVSGLGFEGWLDRLVQASGYDGPVIVASDGLEPLRAGTADVLAADTAEHAEESDHAAAGHAHEGEHDHGAADPHAWQAIGNAIGYVENIADALCAVGPENCDAFRANEEAYVAELRDLDASIKAGFAAIPAERRKVITTHDAFGYFGREYGVMFLAPQGVSTESEASAADVASLIRQIRDEGVTALFVENVSDPRLIEQIGNETGVEPGGALFSDALSEANGPAPTYIEMMRHNAAVLQSAMRGN